LNAEEKMSRNVCEENEKTGAVRNKRSTTCAEHEQEKLKKKKAEACVKRMRKRERSLRNKCSIHVQNMKRRRDTKPQE
jgi:hypothetical protein